MKVHVVSQFNTSLGSQLFAANRPFENVSTSSKSFSQMRDRASPSLTSVSIQNNFRNRGYWWFHNTWSLTVNNNNFSTTYNNVDVQITARHNFGTGNFKARSRNTFISSLGPAQTFQTSFFPPNEGFNTMIMDGIASPNLDFVINVFNVGNVTINFDWGGLFPQSTFGVQLITSVRDLSTWGASRGVNVTVDIS